MFESENPEEKVFGVAYEIDQETWNSQVMAHLDDHKNISPSIKSVFIVLSDSSCSMLVLPTCLHSLQSVCCRVTEILGVFLSCTEMWRTHLALPIFLVLCGQIWSRCSRPRWVSITGRSPPLPYQIFGLTVLEMWINLSDLNDGWDLNEFSTNQSAKHLQWAATLKQTSIEETRKASTRHIIISKKFSAFLPNKAIVFFPMSSVFWYQLITQLICWKQKIYPISWALKKAISLVRRAMTERRLLKALDQSTLSNRC